MIQCEGIHHVSLIVTDLERAKTFYRDVLCLREIARPAFDFPGAWYEIGETGQQLHLIVHHGQTKRTNGIDTRDGHFAIRVSDFTKTVDWLRSKDIEHKTSPNSITGFAQIFLLDPDCNVIELNAVPRG
jgi:glyoxylase I family protein